MTVMSDESVNDEKEVITADFKVFSQSFTWMEWVNPQSLLQVSSPMFELRTDRTWIKVPTTTPPGTDCDIG
jgi:hypothetical protein